MSFINLGAISKEKLSGLFNRFPNVRKLYISNSKLSGIISIPLRKLEELDVTHNYKLIDIEFPEGNQNLHIKWV